MEKSIVIPQSESEIFNELANLPIEEFEEIGRRINSLSLIDKLTVVDLKIALEDKKDYSRIIFGLFYGFISFENNSDFFLTELYKSYEITSKDIKRINKEDFKKKFGHIFHSQSPIFKILSSKYYSSEVQILFLDAKIITDVRPIFSYDNGDEIIGSIVINQLKIIFEEQGEKEELYINLGRNDLVDLKEKLEKAIMKNEVISKKLNDLDSFKLIQ